jgi:transcriptional regulator with XRE-family HTH domain
MPDTDDLRCILSDNIKNARKRLGLTQYRLSIIADLSVPYMTDIERCRTWVSDKTLKKLATALRMKPYQLLLPDSGGESPKEPEDDVKDGGIGFISDEITAQKKAIKRFVEDRMNDLLVQIVKNQGGA